MIVSTAALYRLAYRQYAIGVYNINNLEQILGLFRGCIESQAPFITQRINAAGGKLDPTACGVNENEYLPAAKLGVAKINIDTDGRLVWTRVHREFFRDHPAEFDFRPPGKTFVQEYAKFIAHKNEKLGSAGRLPEIRKALVK